MRILYICLLLLFLTNTFGQVLVDTTLSKQYIQAFSNLPKWLQTKADEAEKDPSYKGGFVVLTDLTTDTLNKEEKKTAGITITDITTIDGKKRKSHSKGMKEKGNGSDLLFCGGQYDYDTLVIAIGAPFYDKAIRQRIVNSKIETEYTESHGSDSIFWSDNISNKTNDLTISARTTKFVLSDTAFSPDKTLYGYCEMETEPYYTSTILFEKGYVKKRLHFKYYFKFKPTKNST